MAFLAEARARTVGIRETVLAHPFVRGIGDGSLTVGRFRHYLAQDYLFLTEYARVLALAVAKAPDRETMERLATLLDATLNTEMQLHRDSCAGFGLSATDLERTEAAPACRAYTDHLVRTAWAGSLDEICAALVPCQQGYAEIAAALAPGSPASNPYAEWIGAYTSKDYRDLAEWICSLTDRLAERAGEAARARMTAAYEASARHELAFWQMAWSGQPGSESQ